jgi:LPS export ABC transporter permease LptG/LPS export ABC transporter permease LptF
MRKIDKLLYHAIIPPFLIALTVLTFIAFIHDLGNISELLITRNASLGVILVITGSILPKILIFSLPLAYLIGILIGLSGLAGESQITALRSCGIPLRALLSFLLWIGLAVGIVTGFFSTVVLPRTNDVLNEVKDRISLNQATSQLQPRVFNEDFPSVVFYVDDLAVDRQRWSRVFLADNSDPKNPRTVVARSGTWISDSTSRRLQIHLEHGSSYAIQTEDPAKDNVSHFISTDIPISLNSHIGTLNELDRKPKKVIEQPTSYLLNHYLAGTSAQKREVQLELNSRISLPFSVFPFAILGLALSANTKKGGRTSGFALSLTAVLGFYMLFTNGIRLASVGKVSPWLGAWGANLLLILLGIMVLARAERGFSLWQRTVHLLFGGSAWGHVFRLDWARNLFTRIDNAFTKSTSAFSRFRFPKVLDLYISRGFVFYFFWSMITCGTLFVLFTLFDLLDDIIRNRIAFSTVLDYFTFLTPQILMIVIPMSVLLAVLINFGIMEKFSEITAIKAGGWSLYRISIPIFLLSINSCIGLFLMQDYVLPYANVRQDGLRNIIKGRPAQTSKRMQRKWIFGESDRIYNYEYFDGNQDSFVDLNVYDIDLKTVQILRRIHAARARIDRQGVWTLEDGWIRDYQPAQPGFKKMEKAFFHFPEKAGYFEKEIFQPKESSKLTYPELKGYIDYLKKSGYNATELQVELNKKIAFPMSCFVMALLGVPFSFSTGRKGAFFGIGISIAIAMSYWGVSGIFEAMGSYGLLVPILAAWAPNILFGATGFVLILTIRT